MNEKFKLKLRQLLSKFTSDSVNFKVDYTHDDYEGLNWPHTDIIINNKSIFKRLKEYELFEAQRTNTNEDLVGLYVGIDPTDLINFFYYRNGVQIFFKESKFSFCQCSKCRSRDCTSHLYCDLKITPLTIEFSNFRQQFDPTRFDNSKRTCPENIEKHNWNYEAFGPFRFPKGEFLMNLKKVIPPSGE